MRKECTDVLFHFCCDYVFYNIVGLCIVMLNSCSSSFAKDYNADYRDSERTLFEAGNSKKCNRNKKRKQFENCLLHCWYSDIINILVSQWCKK